MEGNIFAHSKNFKAKMINASHLDVIAVEDVAIEALYCNNAQVHAARHVNIDLLKGHAKVCLPHPCCPIHLYIHLVGSCRAWRCCRAQCGWRPACGEQGGEHLFADQQAGGAAGTVLIHCRSSRWRYFDHLGRAGISSIIDVYLCTDSGVRCALDWTVRRELTCQPNCLL